ncbi:MAG: hypothetical protein LBN97_07725 [Oscillospiraceae bacterium]|jgi:hypothetical protein|nr:hypothetical protein [Oscillospiraceae bacterium]
MKKKTIDYKNLAFREEPLPNGGTRLICETGAIINILTPFPSGEAGDRIRENASKIAYKIRASVNERVANAVST